MSRSKFRILMLHGFAQTGPFFQKKTRPLVEILRKTISRCYGSRPEDIVFAFPSGPFHIHVDQQYGLCFDQNRSGEESDAHGWWLNLDNSSQYEGIDSSFAALRLLVQMHGPFMAVIGFSQGATLAAMFASWCEIGITHGRTKALRQVTLEDSKLHILSSAPQPPLVFALCFAGFQGTLNFYHAFYEPLIKTPTIHVLGELDPVVPMMHSIELIHSCSEPMVLQHQGAHFVPRYQNILQEIAGKVEHILRTYSSKNC